MELLELRREYHNRICKEIIRTTRGSKGAKGYPNFCDGASKASVSIGFGIVEALEYKANAPVVSYGLAISEVVF